MGEHPKSGRSGLGSALARQALRPLGMPALSRATGWAADRRIPAALMRLLVRTWAQVYGADLTECIVPDGGFRTFNDFFTRSLKPGVRPMGDVGSGLVSPCDARVVSIGAVPEDGWLEQIKGRSYSLRALVASEDDGAYRGGFQATLYLSPGMYHRVHAPVDGRVRSWRHVPGRLYPVNSWGLRYVEQLFTVNERVVFDLETPGAQPVALVMVGATNVGRITLATPLGGGRAGGGLHRFETPVELRRGDELGTFNLGSTVVLLATGEKWRPAKAPGDLVRMGEPLLVSR